jgi:hypothetical protein
MAKGKLQISLIQGQKANSTTQWVDALQTNVTGIVQPVLGADGWIQQEPGLTEYGTGQGSDRGAVWNDRQQTLFRVSGDSLISVSSTGAVTVLGTAPGSDLVGSQAAMPYSFNNQSIVVANRWFLYNPVDGAREPNDPDVGAPIDQIWVDGYFFFTDGEYLYHTDLEDESTINPLKFATSEFSPDRTKGLGLTTDDKVIAFNRFTIEYFANEANEFFAFTRIPSRTVQYGIIGTYAKAQIGGEWFFMGGPAEGSVSIYLLQVGTAQNVSSRAVDNLIAQYSEDELRYSSLETRIVDNYPEVLVRLPNEVLKLSLKVLEFAGKERAWTILSSGIGSGNPYRAIHGVFDPRRAQWVYGDTLNDTLGYLDPDVATHYDEIVECDMFTPIYYLESMSLDQLMIQTVPGFTTTEDATVFFSMSYDGGVTFGTEVSLSYGDPSAYSQRFIAFMLGYVSNVFSCKFRWTSRSRMAFASGSIEYG